MSIVIKSRKLGRLEVEADRLIDFPEGILGFPAIKQYILVENDKGHPLFWLQAVEDIELAFAVTDPLIFKPDYRPAIPEEALHGIEGPDSSSLIIFAILTIPHDDPRKLTANLQAPLVINSKTRRGKQIILYDSGYDVREPVIQAPVPSIL